MAEFKMEIEADRKKFEEVFETHFLGLADIVGLLGNSVDYGDMEEFQGMEPDDYRGRFRLVKNDKTKRLVKAYIESTSEGSATCVDLKSDLELALDDYATCKCHRPKCEAEKDAVYALINQIIERQCG